MSKKEYISTEQAAEYLGVSVHTISSWRRGDENSGPAYTRLGGKVVYLIADLDAWVESCRVEQGE
jgi:excisionase family DNA binding protein